MPVKKTASQTKPAPAKKTAAKKPAAKKATVAAPKKVTTPITDAAMTKVQILTTLADNTGLARKQVTHVLDELTDLIERHLKKKGVGVFNLAGLLKFEVKRKPATKARKGINPFTGEETTFKAKPATNVVKVRALKKLKEMVV